MGTLKTCDMCGRVINPPETWANMERLHMYRFSLGEFADDDESFDLCRECGRKVLRFIMEGEHGNRNDT